VYAHLVKHQMKKESNKADESETEDSEGQCEPHYELELSVLLPTAVCPYHPNLLAKIAQTIKAQSCELSDSQLLTSICLVLSCMSYTESSGYSGRP